MARGRARGVLSAGVGTGGAVAGDVERLGGAGLDGLSNTSWVQSALVSAAAKSGTAGRATNASSGDAGSVSMTGVARLLAQDSAPSDSDVAAEDTERASAMPGLWHECACVYARRCEHRAHVASWRHGEVPAQPSLRHGTAVQQRTRLGCAFAVGDTSRQWARTFPLHTDCTTDVAHTKTHIHTHTRKNRVVRPSLSSLLSRELELAYGKFVVVHIGKMRP